MKIQFYGLLTLIRQLNKHKKLSTELVLNNEEKCVHEENSAFITNIFVFKNTLEIPMSNKVS